MNDHQVQRELGNLDARVKATERAQSTTERRLEKILERLRKIEIRVAAIVAGVVGVAEFLRWVVPQLNGG